MKTKLFIVEAGEWDEYNFVGAFSSEELAQKAMLKYPPGVAWCREVYLNDNDILEEYLIYDFTENEDGSGSAIRRNIPWPSSMEIFDLDVVSAQKGWNGIKYLEVTVNAKTYDEALAKATKLFEDYRTNESKQ